MDRFALYLPGWEMPKNCSEYLTNNYGFITDYLAEAFHYQFKHTNRYEEVNNRIRLGKSVEGRDEKGIKKTVAAFLKILHPAGKPTVEEFDEYVAYAVEGRRRVKEQMNKRKSDDEFAKINLSYFSKEKEIIAYCPESKSASATQAPLRRDIHEQSDGDAQKTKMKTKPTPSDKKQPDTKENPAPNKATEKIEQEQSQLKDQHFTIRYGATGYSYESLITPYLAEAKSVVVEDPYIRMNYQIQNFIRFCEAIIKTPSIKKITLCTSYDEQTDIRELSDRLQDVKQSLIELDIELDIQINEHLHDREIRMDNGWTIKIGRGLDFYQKPDSWYAVGVYDQALRKCLETKIDIFKRGEG
jgi:ATP-dependent Lon protease